MVTRGPLYEKIAHISVNIKKQRVAAVVREIKEKLLKQNLIPLEK
jgi:shikimate kinase